MQEPRTWREFLGKIIRDSHEKQRLAEELDVSPVTLTRWVNGQSKPRLQNLRQLLNALPEHRQKLSKLMGEEFEEIVVASAEQEGDALKELPSSFYARVLHAYVTTPRALRSSSIFTLILQQALAHLDPHKRGMSITVVLCSAPGRDGKIRSLREGIGRGTPPWKSHLDNQVLLLGAESLAGYAVTNFRMVANQHIREKAGYYPVLRTEYEESAVACPLLLDNRVAGCLLLASNVVEYFTPPLQELIQQYANLMVLACDAEQFYEQGQLELTVMPAPAVQQSYFTTFQQRVTNILLGSMREGEPLSRTQAERLVWQQLEREFIRMPKTFDEEDSTGLPQAPAN